MNCEGCGVPIPERRCIMQKTRDEINRIVTELERVFPLPKGYRYYVEGKKQDTIRTYILSVVRDDFKGGSVFDAPYFYSLPVHEFVSHLAGMVNGKRLLDTITMLKEANK
jgi:hypothetical protein